MKKVALLVAFLLVLSLVSAVRWFPGMQITGMQVKAGPQTPPPPPPSSAPAEAPVDVCPHPACPAVTGTCQVYFPGQRCPSPLRDFGALKYPQNFPSDCPRNPGTCCCSGELLPAAKPPTPIPTCVQPGEVQPSPILLCPKFCDVQGPSEPSGVGEPRKVCKVKSNLVNQPVGFAERLTKCAGDIFLGFRTEACTCRAEPVSTACPNECPLVAMPPTMPGTLGLTQNTIPNVGGAPKFLCWVDFALRGQGVPCAGYVQVDPKGPKLSLPFTGPSPLQQALQNLPGMVSSRSVPCFCRTPPSALPSCPVSGPQPVALPRQPSAPALPTPRIAPFIPAALPPGLSDEEVCKRNSLFVEPDCQNNCVPEAQICKEKGLDYYQKRVRCYNCIAAPPKPVIPVGVTPPPTPKRIKEAIYPFGTLDECKKVQTFSKSQPFGEQCLNTCPSDKECRVVDVCAGGAPPRCPDGSKDCPREQKICNGIWKTCFNCETKLRLIEVKVEKKAEVVVGPAQVQRQVIKAEIPTEVIGICNEASKQLSEAFGSVISPPKPEGCASGCKLVKFNVPTGSARCCCCGPCRPLQPVARTPTLSRPSPEVICAELQQRVSAQGAPFRVSIAAAGACPTGCQMQDLKLAQCCLCKI